MSYEGYTEYLCKHGHYWTVGAHVYDICDDEVCSECLSKGVQSKAVWHHAVDQTNGIEYDEHGKELAYTVPFPLEVDHYEEHVIKIPIYKVPKHE